MRAVLHRGARYLSVDRLFSPSSIVIGSSIGVSALRLCSTLLLTRLLMPSVFGVVAIISSTFYVIAMITDAGFEAYLVRHERADEPEFLDSIWSVHLARGLINALLAASIAVPVSHLLQKPGLAPLLAAASVSLAIDGAASLSMITALRRRLVRRLSMIDVIAQASQFIVGGLLAWILRDAWALVAATITGSLVRTSLSYIAFPHSGHRWRFDPTLTLELWRFSRVIALSSAMTLVIAQVDKLVLARVFSLAEFGVYAVAANLAAAPIAVVALYMGRIFYPAIAAVRNAEISKISDQYYALRGIVVYGYLLAGGLLVGLAPLVIHTLYDERYAGAGLFLRLLGITTTLTMLTRCANDALVAIGKTDFTVKANVVRVVWLIIVGVGALFAFGPLGLVTALAVIELPTYLFGVYVLSRAGIFRMKAEMRAILAAGVGVVLGFGLNGLIFFLL